MSIFGDSEYITCFVCSKKLRQAKILMDSDNRYYCSKKCFNKYKQKVHNLHLHEFRPVKEW